MEDRELELMETLEGQRGQLARWDEELGDKKAKLRSVLANYAERSGRLLEQVAALEGQRKEIVPRVNGPLLKRYEQIRVRQGGLGLVRVTGDTCPGCRVTLASELQKELWTGRVGLTCDNCGRLLYREKAKD